MTEDQNREYRNQEDQNQKDRDRKDRSEIWVENFKDRIQFD
jgi:hypothetical protein